MFTKYDFTHSFWPEAVCLPKGKPNFRILQIYSFSYTYNKRTSKHLSPPHSVTQNLKHISILLTINMEKNIEKNNQALTDVCYVCKYEEIGWHISEHRPWWRSFRYQLDTKIRRRIVVGSVEERKINTFTRSRNWNSFSWFVGPGVA